MLPTTARLSGFSLSTKLTIFAIVVEFFVISGGLYLSQKFLSNQRMNQMQSMLSSQLLLLEKEASLQKEALNVLRFTPVGLSDDFFFQIADNYGRILWDSNDAKRANTLIPDSHPLFKHARPQGGKFDFDEFVIPQTDEHFVGASKMTSDNYVIMGAFSVNEAQTETYRMIEKFICLAFLFAGISFLIIVFLANRVIRPIHELTAAAIKISGGEFDFTFSPPGKDEIGVLSSAFSSMAQRVRDLLKGEIEKVRMTQEVNSVAQIQQSLLPDEEIQTDRFEIHSYYQSATETGGDYWGYFETPKHAVIYVADATGHGLSSAMLTAAARGCFSAMHRLMLERPDLPANPSQLLSYANTAVLDSAHEELNMTMFIATYSFEDQTLTYANAGHNPAWIIRNDHGKPRIEVLHSMGPRLGEGSNFETTVDKVTQLFPNDTLFLYTDGLLDCMNSGQEAFGKNRSKDLILAHSNLSVKNIRDHLVEAINTFTEGKPLRDDITFALFKRRGGE